MKLSSAMLAVVGILGSGMIFATGSYYPPERINCQLNESQKISCYDFNREYLIEDYTNADLDGEVGYPFHFLSAAAYFTPNHQESTIFFTYANANNKRVKLRTVNTFIRPDLINGNWRALATDVYVCTSSYMQCLITDTPEYHP